MDVPAIRATKLTKEFRLPHERHSSLKSAIINFRRFRYEQQSALRDITFDVMQGEFFGILGRNGSGKSTLLKLMAGIYTPTAGDVRINGRLTPFIELGVGFNPELSGRDNVYLNGALLGFGRKEVARMYDEIVAFAELERFMDQKLKNYSSGMQVRLAFSVAIRARSDILLIDEVLAVGDARFQQKCFDYFGEIQRLGVTVVLVSHDLEVVQRFCQRSLLVDNGDFVKIGPTAEVVSTYYDRLAASLEAETERRTGLDGHDAHGDRPNQAVIITKIETRQANRLQRVFRPGDSIEVEIGFEIAVDIAHPVVGLVITNAQGTVVVATNTFQLGGDFGEVGAGTSHRATFAIPNYLTDGEYRISCAVNKEQGGMSYARNDFGPTFEVVGFAMKHSLTHLPVDLTIE